MENVSKAVELKRELDALRPIKPEYELKVMQKFRLDWNYHSNNLEGNSLTYGETKALILFGITAQGKPLKDHFEITGHNEAVKWITDIIKDNRPLTENFIRELHRLILKEPYEVDAITAEGKPTKKKVRIGVYKTLPNHVETKTGEIFRFASPEETPAKMNDLIVWYREKSKVSEINPILLASEFHYRFIRIHPFDDGNGRTARILMNFILMQFGYPPVIIKTDDKENYFAALRQADAGMLEPFVDYIAGNLIRSLEIMINGAKGKDIEEEEDLDKEIKLLEQKLNSLGGRKEAESRFDRIAKVYDDFIFDLGMTFQKECKKLAGFYLKTAFTAHINTGKNLSYFKDHPMIQVRQALRFNTSRIRFNYLYEHFNQNGFKPFNFSSGIEVHFQKNGYRVYDGSQENGIVKSYSESLSKNEISQIVKQEIWKHKTFIEKKIQEFEEKINNYGNVY